MPSNGFALVALVLYSSLRSAGQAWALVSGLWALYMVYSLYHSRQLILENLEHHQDIDKIANRVVFCLFFALIVLQFANVILWRDFAPVLAALVFNLAGAAMQFSRLIQSAFRG